MTRAIFFGTPGFSVPCLEALTSVATVVGVVCQPDRPVGRGLTLTPPPVKARALELGIPVVQPTKLKTGAFGAWVRAQAVDVALVVAYGRILPSDVLAGPRLGCLNVHASILPKFRGAAPISRAIMAGETETGITLMQLDEGMDTGNMITSFPTTIGENETAGELADRLAQMGADAIRSCFARYIRGDFLPQKQDDSRATLAPPLRKEEGKIDFTLPAKRVHDHVRGVNPWPGAFTKLRDGEGGKTVKIHATRVSPASREGAPPGTVILADKTHVVVACGEGAVELVTVQLEGRKAVRATDWFLGRGVAENDVLG
ncbi:methionyl-tRNA formyltransferase [Pendulispora albinea]|uniref:Methionyl-tRNA formyltransferase n=1 Tax=Pendulispora albinea TaxID=2741071 RepID=A0ABZ2M1K9_9BACT